jgi:phosphoribosylamine--glycine ligase
MRFLGVTETCDLGALYLRLVEGGHEVRVSISDPLARGTMAGLVEHVAEWRDQLDWVRAAEPGGIILFEAVSEGLGALQDALRRDGFNVIGGSEYGDRLENDRVFGQQVLADLGLPVAATREFDDVEAAEAYVAERPRRYVLKFSGSDYASDNYVGQHADGDDVRAMLRARGRAKARFVLMDHISGVEMGVGAYFDGEKFLTPACLDWEHKRFFAGDMGELTGEMGTVATFARSSGFFDRTLARVAPLLRAHGHVGYVNLNTIVNANGIWPLEFTCRFGYPGFAVLDPLQRTSWADLLAMMVSGKGEAFEAEPGFSVGVVLTTPPFPYSRKQVDEPIGLPVLLPDLLDAEKARHFHFGEIGLVDGRLATSGLYGWTMVVTGTGATIEQARRAAYARAGRVSVPNLRYRLDIGKRVAASDYAEVDALGLLD